MGDAPSGRQEEGTWSRLRRRKVVQWGIAYVAGAWALLQALGYLSGLFDWPRQIQQIAMLPLAIGLLVVVVQSLKVSLMGPTKPAAAHTTNADAYVLYLQARALERSAGEGDFAAAVGHLQRAVALDPTFAAAWAELAAALLSDLGWHSVEGPSADLCVRVHEAANQALALAPALAESHRSKAGVFSVCDQDLKAAETEIKRALELDPQNAAAWIAYSWVMVKASRWDDAIRFGQEAVSRDPLNAWHYFPVA